jgi:hypothetical protein
MYIKFGISLLLICSCIAPAFAQNKIIHACNTEQAIQDERLQITLEKLITKIGAIEVLADDQPCVHKKSMINAFKRTFGQDISKSISAHTFSFLRSESGLFSIDKFIFKNQAAINDFEKKIHQRKNNNLQVKSLTYYSYFFKENEVIFFSATGNGFKENQVIFTEIEKIYMQTK